MPQREKNLKKSFLQFVESDLFPKLHGSIVSSGFNSTIFRLRKISQKIIVFSAFESWETENAKNDFGGYSLLIFHFLNSHK